MPGIFINYRGDDGEGYAIVLKNRMSQDFHPDLVFFASKSIRPGSDYTVGLLDGVRQSNVLLAVIGQNWLEDRDGRRRLDNEDDWVRRELLEAVTWDIPIIPVLVSGAKMPQEADLPPELAALARTQYVRLGYQERDEVLLIGLTHRVHELAEELAPAAVELSRLDDGPSLPAPKARSRPERLRAVATTLVRIVETDLEAERRQSGDVTLGDVVTWSVPDGAVKSRPLNEIAEGYLGLAGHRMILLGDAGAGKTVAASLLALDVLRKGLWKKLGVPVLLPLSTWNVHKAHLLDWIAEHIAQTYPGVANRRAIVDLVVNHRVLPILDGLDEVHDDVRARVVTEIHRGWGPLHPFVLTCRSEEHHAFAEGDLAESATISHLAPVSSANARRFIRDRLPGQRWDGVQACMERDPAGPLATAFSAPLTLWLARHTAVDPARLLEFTDAKEITDHLLDGLLPAVFAERPPDPGSRRAVGNWGVARSTTWLAVLARWLISRNATDLRWWEMFQMASRRHFATLNAAVALIFITPLLAWHWHELPLLPRLGWAAAGGLIIGVTIAKIVTDGGNLVPVRLDFRPRATLSELFTGLSLTLGAGAVGGLTVHLLSDDAATSPVLDIVAGAVFALPVGVLVAIVGSLLLTVSDDAPLESMNSGVTLRNDRRAAFTAAGIFMAGIGLPLSMVAPTGSAVLPLFLALAVVLLMFHAWGRYRIIASTLALTGRLPWRLNRFLEDAYDLGVLRKLGPAYQFRHRDLRDRLGRDRS